MCNAQCLLYPPIFPKCKCFVIELPFLCRFCFAFSLIVFHAQWAAHMWIWTVEKANYFLFVVCFEVDGKDENIFSLILSQWREIMTKSEQLDWIPLTKKMSFSYMLADAPLCNFIVWDVIRNQKKMKNMKQKDLTF